MFITKRKLAEIIQQERSKIYDEQERQAEMRRLYERIEKIDERVWKNEHRLDEHINKSKKAKLHVACDNSRG